MMNAVRSCLEEEHKLSGTVELDETYMGNSARYARGKRKRGRGTMKAPIFGAVERGGAVVAKVVPDTKRDTVMPIVRESVERYSEVYTDEYAIYNTLDEEGYLHDTVCHGAGQYVKYRKEIADDGTYETTEVHTNSVEGFWSYPKIATKGVHRGVSDHKLQGYLNEYTFRHSHRNDEEPMFFAMFKKIVPAERLAA